MADVYPASDYDRAKRMMGVLGSFWTRTFTRPEQVRSYTDAKCQLETQTYQDTLEAVAALSRFTVPLFHKDTWYLLTLRESEMNTAATTMRKFDEADVAFDDNNAFDAPVVRQYYRFVAPPTLVTVPLIMNRLTEPSVVLTNNADYQLADGVLVLRSNPFENELLPMRPIYENGEVVDREVALWLFRGDFDWQHVYTHFGYVLNLYLKSSGNYRDFVNAIFDALVAGSPSGALDAAFAAIADVPLVRETQETVEVILHDCTGLQIITDHHVYSFRNTAQPTVAVGDVVYAGDALTDALQIDEFNSGEIPAGLTQLALGKGFLLNCFYGDLVFTDKDMPLIVNTDHPTGYTYCSFAIGGFPGDVERFFDEMHTRGIHADNLRDASPTCSNDQRGTLAQLLDTRANRTDEPAARHLPATINPLKFLIENVLRNHAYLVRLRAGALGRGKLGLYNMRHLKRLLPPHTAVFIAVELPAQSDTITAASITEQITHLQGLPPQSDTVTAASLSERIIIRLVSGTCQ